MIEPAFPAMHFDLADNEHGLTMRDYFAAKAMQAILEQKDVHDGREWGNTAWMSYKLADAMMEARNAAQ